MIDIPSDAQRHDRETVEAVGITIAQTLIESQQLEKLLKHWLREVVLRVVIEQEDQRELGFVRSFLQCCQARGVSVKIDRWGKIWCKPRERLGQTLELVLAERREAIAAYLVRLRDSEAKQWSEGPPAVAGKVGG